MQKQLFMQPIIALLLFWALTSSCYAGGIVLGQTRVIYYADKKEAALPVTNNARTMPFLLQSWVENEKGNSRGPFIVTPPLFRINGGESSTLRIIKTDASLPEDRESLFYIDVRAIPASSVSDTNKNLLTLVVKTRIKLFYRPGTLKDKAVDAYKKLQFNRTQDTLYIYNPTEYFVVFSGLSIGNTELTDKIDFISPGEHKKLPVPVASGSIIKWAAINDYGGVTQTLTRSIQE
ncbi:fimbrial biogenesis chaperone [Franconibacter pulveris 1160]|uniref:Fimbrial protein n=2 Tax=Franconibacter TaxID=1649295 RepID=A0A0J8VQE5_9ENTR|nr:fimbrial protein [Franconibacter pulveris]